MAAGAGSGARDYLRCCRLAMAVARLPRNGWPILASATADRAGLVQLVPTITILSPEPSSRAFALFSADIPKQRR